MTVWILQLRIEVTCDPGAQYWHLGHQSQVFLVLPSFLPLLPGDCNSSGLLLSIFFPWEENVGSLECGSKERDESTGDQKASSSLSACRCGHLFICLTLSLSLSPPPFLLPCPPPCVKTLFSSWECQNLTWPEIAFESSPLLTSKHFMSKEVKVQTTHKIAAYLKTQIHALSEVAVFWSPQQWN